MVWREEGKRREVKEEKREDKAQSPALKRIKLKNTLTKNKILIQKGQKKDKKDKGKYGKRLSGSVKRAMKAENANKKSKK